MKIINTATNEIVGEILTNHGMTLDEALNFVYYDWNVDQEGEIIEQDAPTGIYYNDLQMQD